MAIAGRGRGSGPRASADAEPARTGGPDRGDRPAEFRYGAVFLIVLVLVVFLVVAPDEGWARAVALALETAALTIAVATSRVRPAVRHRRAVVGLVVGVAVAIGVLTGIVSEAAVAVREPLATTFGAFFRASTSAGDRM